MDAKEHQKPLEGESAFEETSLSNGNRSLLYTWVKTSWHWIISVHSLYCHERIAKLWTDRTLLSRDKDNVAEFLQWESVKLTPQKY